MASKQSYSEFWKRRGPLDVDESELPPARPAHHPMIGSVSVQGTALFLGDLTESTALQVIAAIQQAKQNGPG